VLAHINHQLLTPSSPLLNYEIQYWKDGAFGPNGDYINFPDYEGSAPPVEYKKPFTHFCIHTRNEVKASLDVADRKNKVRTLYVLEEIVLQPQIFYSRMEFLATTTQKKANDILKELWFALPEEEVRDWREWTEWDRQRHTSEVAIFESRRMDDGASPKEEDNTMKSIHVPRKRKPDSNVEAIPKKKKRSSPDVKEPSSPLCVKMSNFYDAF
jgi:hypothetical protein